MISTRLLKEFSHLLLGGKFGLEKEQLRVNTDGHLVLTPHPEIFGNKSSNPYITTDFSESQIELITPALESIEEMCFFIETLHSIVSEEIGDEILWSQSLPPLLPEEEHIPLAKFSEQNKEKELYREKLVTTYGKNRQMISGIHFNLSLRDELINALYSELRDFNEDKCSIRGHLYMKITRGMMRYRWLMIWLYGKTPVSDPSFSISSEKGNVKMKCPNGISLRTGPMGYRNKKDYTYDFETVAGYHASIDALINSGEINDARELYVPIRMKFFDEDCNSPSYLELRFIDLDPMSSYGVDMDNLCAVYVLYIYSLLLDETSSFDADAQREATLRHDYVSCHGRYSESVFPAEIARATSINEEALMLVNDIQAKLEEFGLVEDINIKRGLESMRNLSSHPQERGGVKIFEACERDGFINYHLDLAKRYKEYYSNLGYRLWGKEDMEMSTQLLIRAAMCKGINVEILDRSENFIRLHQGTNTHLVVQATKTSIDNYTTVLAMENKVVTKLLLRENDIAVPRGGEYFDKQSALSDYGKYAGKAIVVKPKSTNFGTGITIIKSGLNRENFERAFDIAFQYDNCILIEEFITGREFRIFVIGDEVVGILHRVPANIEGDGKRTIRDLVQEKNLDPRRGKGYKTPLEKIALGEEEALFLELQGYAFDTVPKSGEIVYLRENSNISTGGDSLDFTDDVHESYKKIAIKAAKVVKAKITGVDMMIDDIEQVATSSNHSIIEMNFNPALHIHCFPYKGKNRRINFKVLDALGY